MLLCRVKQNGVETVTVMEDGVVVSKTVNGKAAALEDGGSSAIEGSGHSKHRGKRSVFCSRGLLLYTCILVFRVYCLRF